MVRVATAGDATEFRVSKRQAEEVKATLPRLLSQAAPNPVSPSNGSGPSIADELRKLGELRDAGLLTEAEFAEQKVRLLGSQGST
jgi:Short C-terminal domain